MPFGRDRILAFYDELAMRGGWAFVRTTREFAETLFRERELLGCYFFTSHSVLCISRFQMNEERDGQPLLSITPFAPNRLRFELLCEFSQQGDVCREVEERIVCPAERGLEQFDRLYAKFVAAHGRRGGAGSDSDAGRPRDESV